ncbi:Asp/Glu racemase [Ruegeria atlantica]|uniref:Asp/Glu racemase n=1 Tax=Ruegeria atlantica TaxID=81569 RepID=A0AA91BZB8_9RHOB|nr:MULTISPECIES: aspartate/glutamate racemase family protein [Ruegeria]NOC90439.1 Asp/Glu racemase [Ruegeria sp. HKCCD6604]NOD29745.1 Asp/Glu racemase [Ruegeria atlantica]NOE17336.1 Asp/Glu racemase [Ruegeria atlantica]
MTYVPYTLDEDDPQAPPLGLIVLQVDETIEPEFSTIFSGRKSPLYVTRIPSGIEVTPESLAEMEEALPAAAGLLPSARPFRVVGYGCTSASSVIGSERVEELVKQSCKTKEVTNPLRAATACAADLGVSRFALLSPYIEEVNAPLRAAFSENGITMDVFGTFGQAEEAKVARISVQSVIEAATELGSDPSVEAVFISCTNLRTIEAIPEIRKRIGKPVLSSNQSLAWHMGRLNLAD